MAEVLVAAVVVVGCASAAPSARPSSSTAPLSGLPSSSPSDATSASPSSSTAPSPSDAATATPDAPSAEPTATDSPTEEPMTGAAGPGCGTGQLGYFSHRDEVPRAWHFGAATIEFTGAGFGLRNGTYAGDDAIPAGLGLEEDELAVRVDPGTHILLRADGASLTHLDVTVVPWKTVSFSGGLGSSGADRLPLVWRLRPDGSISVSAPDAAGDYMVDFHPVWETACLRGDGSAYSRIKVNG